MSDAPSSHERLIADLVADLQPVRRVAPPTLQALAWIAVVLALAVGLASFANISAIEARLMAVPDMWLAVLGSTLTAGLSAMAAFQLSMPDHSPRWALLPLPALALWVGASGMGCARSWLIPGTSDATLAESAHCITFIVALSVPLSVLIVLMLRRGYSMYPTLTGGTAGLAVAAAAATLLNFFHPYDAALEDLLVHGLAVALVVGANRALGGMLLRGRTVQTR